MNRPRQAIVLAAGRGSRLGAFTETQPKCLYPLAGQPLLGWTLQALRANGIEKVLIVGGWQAQALLHRGIEVRVNHRWKDTNMVRSLLLASDWLLAEPTLIVYGDGAYGTSALRAALVETDHDLAVPVDCLWLQLWARRFANPLLDAETLTRQEGRLLSIGQRAQSLDEVQAQFMGLVRTTPRGWQATLDLLAQVASHAGAALLDRLDMTGLLSSLITHGQAVHAIEVFGGWVEIDSPGDAAAVMRGLDQPGFSHDFRH